MLIDKDHEDFFQFNTPLSGVDALQAQSQEQMSSVSNIPLVKLLGTQPAGLNATSEGEIQVYYDYLAAMQETLFRAPLEKIIDIIQLDLFGEIDPDIVFEFESLYGMTDVEKATVRKSDADRDAVLVSIGAVSPDEVRQRVASDPESGYDMLEGELEDDDDPDLEARKELLTVKSRINDQ
jgi:phage-related protein (TIGR01555 family)